MLHEADPFGDEHVGMWLVYAPGSGIYFNLGTTISFAEHQDAYDHFNIPAGVDQNEAMSRAVGLTGVQHVPHTSPKGKPYIEAPARRGAAV